MRVPLKMNEQFHNCSEMLLDLGFYGGNGSLERRSLARRKQKREKIPTPVFLALAQQPNLGDVGRDQLQLFASVG